MCFLNLNPISHCLNTFLIMPGVAGEIWNVEWAGRRSPSRRRGADRRSPSLAVEGLAGGVLLDVEGMAGVLLERNIYLYIYFYYYLPC